MRASGLRGLTPKKWLATTRRAERDRPAPDLVDRDFTAAAPGEKWCADITYVPTWAGFVFLAVVIDCFTRRIVGWTVASHMRTSLVLDALAMAVHRQRVAPGVIHHSDQGSQYTSGEFERACRQLGVLRSMGSVADCYDNAMVESFFATLEKELLDRHRFATGHQARTAIFDWIERWYNPKRRHSSLGNLSPAEFERRWHTQTRAA